jgi:hypothetical protein
LPKSEAISKISYRDGATDVILTLGVLTLALRLFKIASDKFVMIDGRGRVVVVLKADKDRNKHQLKYLSPGWTTRNQPDLAVKGWLGDRMPTW